MSVNKSYGARLIFPDMPVYLPMHLSLVEKFPHTYDYRDTHSQKIYPCDEITHYITPILV